MSKSSEFDLYVFISHFVPQQKSCWGLVRDFLYPRFSIEYLRSWARLLKHGTRGNQPWKRDIMTLPREKIEPLRAEYLATAIRSIELLDVKSKNIHVYTNENWSYSSTDKSTSIIVHQFSRYSRMNRVHNSPWKENDEDSPWGLLWEHKKTLQELAHSKISSRNLYLILENDILFNQANLDYWIQNRENLKSSGLIPTFLVVEYSLKRSQWVAINLHNKRSSENIELFTFKIQDNQYFQLPELYSALFLLDHELLLEYCSSKAAGKETSRELIWWDLGARSNMGLQFVNYPAMFKNRYSLGIDSRSTRVVGSALVHHLPNLYCSVPELDETFPSLEEISVAISREMVEKVPQSSE